MAKKDCLFYCFVELFKVSETLTDISFNMKKHLCNKILAALLVTTGLAAAQGYPPPPGFGTGMPMGAPGMGPAPTLPAVPQYPAYPAPGMDMTMGAPPPTPGFQPMAAPAGGGGMMGGTAAGIGPSLLTYNYLEGQYQYHNPKGNDLDGSSGIGLALSAQLFQPLYIKGSFDWSSVGGGSTSKNGYDFSSISMGGGLYMAVFNNFHFTGEVGGTYAKLDASKDALSFSDGAVYVRPGVRFTPVDFLELQAGVTVNSADTFDSKIIDVAAYMRVFSQLDLGLGADFGNESTSIKGGVRFRW